MSRELATHSVRQAARQAGRQAGRQPPPSPPREWAASSTWSRSPSWGLSNPQFFARLKEEFTGDKRLSPPLFPSTQQPQPKQQAQHRRQQREGKKVFQVDNLNAKCNVSAVTEAQALQYLQNRLDLSTPSFLPSFHPPL